MPGRISSARPRRCKRCRRPISSRRWRCSFGSLKRSICTRPSSPASRCNVRSRLVHRSCPTSRCKVCWISSSVRGPSHLVASSAARWRAVGDVVARDDEVFAGVVASAHDQVGVRVVGVPVIHRHPIQPRPQVGFHPVHQVPGVGTQVVQFGAVLGETMKRKWCRSSAARS